MAEKPKYLVQEIEGQEPFIYAWTPVLAKKKDMRPISNKDAEKILNLQRAKSIIKKEPVGDQGLSDQAKARQTILDEQKEAREKAEAQEFVDGQEEDNKILDNLKPDTTTVQTEKTGNLEVTQEDILAEDTKCINRLRVKSSVEEYMLKKYKIDLLPMKTPEEMKEQAISMLTALAGIGSLYQKK
jgi:hypothetical protein